MIIKIIRFILTGVLLIGVYFETGWWTAGSLGLIALSIETQKLINSGLLQCFDSSPESD